MTINEAIKECKEFLKPRPICRYDYTIEGKTGKDSAYNSRDIALYTILLELLEREKQREEERT